VHVREVRRATRALCALGAGSGKRVCLIGFNRPEWVTFDLASMCAGGAPAGIYTTCSPDEVQYVAHHAEAPVVLVENAAQWEKIRARRAELPHLKHVVMMRGPKVDDPMVLSWEQFLARGDAVEEHRVDDLVAALEPQGLATLIYTSGTTGPPKGVMLSHENLAWTSALLQRLVGGAADDVFLSYLPLSHIAEQMATIHGPITSGAAVYYAESLDKIGDNLREVRPQVFFGVPRVWEKMHATIMTKLAGATGMKKRLVQWARRVGTASSALSMRGRPLSGALAVQALAATPLIVAGILRSARGAKGGVSLAKLPEEIKLSEVIQALEGSLAPVECINNPAVCSRSRTCVTRDVWEELKNAMNGVLEAMTLRDLVERQKKKELPGKPMYYI